LPGLSDPSPKATSMWPHVTGAVALDGVAGAFDALARPDEQVKILVEPASA